MSQSNFLSEKEIQELSSKEGDFKLVEFSGMDSLAGEVYVTARERAVKYSKFLGVRVIAVSEGIDQRIFRRAIEERVIGEANAFVEDLELKVESNFSIDTCGNADSLSHTSYNIHSVLYFHVDEEKLKEFRTRQKHLDKYI